MPNTRKKIAVVIPNLQGGGCERTAAALLPELAEHYDVDLIVQNRTIAYAIPANLNLIELGIDTDADRSLPFKCWRFVRRVYSLARLFRQRRYDLILSFMDLNNVFVWAGNRLCGRRACHIAVEQTICDEYFRFNPFGQRYGRWMRPLLGCIYRRVDVLVALSHSMATYMREAMTISREIEVVYNGIDTSVFRPSEVGVQSPVLDPVYAKSPLRLLNAGRLEIPQKNQDFVIRLMPPLRERHPQAELFLIGTGPDEASLHELVAELGLTESVHFLGWKTDLADYLRGADVLLHGARYETFGNVLIEALACGTPVVVTDSNAVIREILKDVACGHLVAPGDADGFVEAVSIALVEKTQTELTRAASDHVRSTFDMQRTTQRYLQIIERTLADRKSG